jgi:hypothetical protein
MNLYDEILGLRAYLNSLEEKHLKQGNKIRAYLNSLEQRTLKQSNQKKRNYKVSLSSDSLSSEGKSYNDF